MKMLIFLFSLLFTVMKSCVLEISKDEVQGWRIISKDKPPEKMKATEIIKWCSSETYLFLLESEKKEYQIYYWLGNEVVQEHIIYTVKMIGSLIKQLHEKTNSELTLTISREVENDESKTFQKLCKLIRPKPQKLYQIAGCHGEFITELTPDIRKFNVNDTFVFDNDVTLYIWSPEDNDSKREVAELLAKYIKDNEKDKNTEIIALKSNNIENFKKSFFTNIPSESKFLTEKSLVTNPKLQNEKEERIEVTEYLMKGNGMKWTQIMDRPLVFQNFRKDRAYVIRLFYNRNTFVCFGEKTKHKLIRTAILTAETNHRNKKQRDSADFEPKKIIIVNLDKPLPANLMVNFEDLKHNFLIRPIYWHTSILEFSQLKN